MITMTETWTDFNGVQRTESFDFNFTQQELIELEHDEKENLTDILKKIIDTKDGKGFTKFVKKFMLKAYGEKSADGRRFIKSEEISVNFSQTEAFSNMYMRFVTDDNAFANFVTGVIPKSLAEEAKKLAESNDKMIALTK